eukprot:c24206_g10_i1 orf=398-2725(+)
MVSFIEAELRSNVSLELLKKLCRQGQLHQALDIVGTLCGNARCGVPAVFSHLLQCCLEKCDIAGGRAVHSLIAKSGLESDTVLGSYLIRMFTLGGNLVEASQVFCKLSEPNVFSWSAIISAHSNLGKHERALELYHEMKKSGLDADGHVYLAVLKACASSACILWGNVVHFHVIEGSCESDAFVCNALIDMYAKCSCLEDAQYIFEKSSKRDAVTYNALIAGLVQHGHESEALNLFQQMQHGEVSATRVTFACVLKACSNLGNFNQGMLIHFYVIETGSESNLGVLNTLIDMYLKCGSPLDALALYKRSSVRSLVTWNVMVSGLVQQGHGDKALLCWDDMLREGVQPDRISFVASLKACANLGALCGGRLIHMHMLEVDCGSDTSVSNTLLDMYCVCGALDDALAIFTGLPKQDVVAWNVIMKGMVQQDCQWETLQLFRQMQLEGVAATGFTYVCILNAYASLLTLTHGKLLHACVVSGSRVDVQMSNALIDMYIKCKSLGDAHKVFNKSSQCDMGAWNTMIAGYVQHGKSQEALELFVDLHQAGLEPDRITFVCILKVCSVVAALDEGKIVHTCISSKAMESKISIVNAVIDMYGKCGSMEDAQRVFDQSLTRDVVTWSALMSGYVQQGDYKVVLKMFQSMQHEGVKPDGISLACLLSACCHLGKVKEGYGYFNTMNELYGIHPGIEHCNSLVDLLGRAGHLYETQWILENMPFKSNSVGWSSLLGHCNTHGNFKLGKRCLDNIAVTDEEYATGVVLFSKLYDQSFQELGMSKS